MKICSELEKSGIHILKLAKDGAWCFFITIGVAKEKDIDYMVANKKFK